MMDKAWNYETDVAVVGGGGAGLAAAVQASAVGAKVILIEKRPQLGGTTSIAIGSFTAARSRLQIAAGIADDPAWHDEDIGKFAPSLETHNNQALRSFLTQHTAATLAWLEELGLEFRGPNPEPPNRVPRMHNVVPNAKAYIAALQKRALRNGVRMCFEHRVERLLREDGGTVVGLEARRVDGALVRIAARKGVILAAGDYSNGAAVKRDYLSAEVSAVEGINPHSTGDGHRLARDAGAELLNMEIVYGPEVRFVPPPRAPFTQLLPANPFLAKIMAAFGAFLPKSVLTRAMKSLLVTWQHPEISLLRQAALINREGRRFVDEGAGCELAIPRQPDKIAYVLLDGSLAEIYSKWPNFISTAPEIAYAYVQDYKRLRGDVYSEAPTLEALALKIQVDPAVLRATMDTLRRAARGEAPDPFGRQSFPTAFENPPFIAFGPAKSWIVTTEGGVRINDRMQALDIEGEVIPHLYAAGSNGMGGIVVWGHGLHIAWALTSGRLAGLSAAESALAAHGN